MPIDLEERDILKEVNSSTEWAARVDEMPSSQVTDIFLMLISQGRI